MYKYPYGDSQQLNLDWILAKLKELEASGGANLEEISNALVALTYNPDTLYARYDYAFRNDKLYRCLTGTTGAFDPDAWQEALIGDDLAVLTRWINAIDAAAVVDVKFDTTGTNGKIQQKYHEQYHDVVEVDYTPVQNSKRPLSSNAGYDLNNAINNEVAKRETYIKPNLFDNWYFVYGKEINNDYSNDGTFPINQRGNRVYGAGYGLDRWICDNTPMYCQIDKDYITIWNGTNFEQVLDPAVGRGIIGKEVTFSILTGNNDLGSGSGIVQDTDGVSTVYSTIRGEGSVWFIIGVTPSRDVHCYIQLGHGSSAMPIKAVKLELGSIQTLAHQENGAWVLNEIPDYYDELGKCRKYLQIVKGGTNDVAVTIPYATTDACVAFYTTVDTTRTVNLNGSSPDAFQFDTGSFSTPAASNSIDVQGKATGSSITIHATTTGTGANALTVGAAHRVRIPEGKTLFISAEL